ncbi:hypothetical protein GTO91_16790 [Heliobacterium undosum]|uniref:Uncharacterized protein n=1 Tax=Heliomicrobium undosum TaxID=121734 RepID=A0A845L7U1_9FIRM|nr:TrmB family transcriptional regulator [Heliomicrobium undosum]MZP31359.1 hypothetical protein [Heliomicrobium undosum]
MQAAWHVMDREIRQTRSLLSRRKTDLQFELYRAIVDRASDEEKSVAAKRLDQNQFKLCNINTQEQFIQTHKLSELKKHPDNPIFYGLTPRHRQALIVKYAGGKSVQMAQQLGMTVESYRQAIREATGIIQLNAAALQEAHSLGLTEEQTAVYIRLSTLERSIYVRLDQKPKDIAKELGVSLSRVYEAVRRVKAKTEGQ